MARSLKMRAALVVGAVAALAILGPRARVEEEAVAPVALPEDVDGYLRSREEAVPGLREGEEKAVVWADPERRTPTDLAVVYLHGFSADRHEISPVAERVADSLGANLFLTRLTGHGQGGDALGEATAEDWLQDTEEALAVGARLGRRTVLVGTSTGGTLAVWAAEQERWRGSLAAVVLLSPNFGPRDPGAGMLLWPWGEILARIAVGTERCFEPLNQEQARHWTTCYPTRALLAMMALVELVRSSDLGLVRAPLLVLYSPQDAVVDARATERLFPRFGSERKELLVLEGADPSHHILAGDIVSPGSTDRSVAEILRFLHSLPAAGTLP
jgi:esterase/lipase